jgi:urate oxidase
MTTFTEGYSKALQHTLYQMAEAVISKHDSIDEIKFSCPNKHHFTYDLSFCGLDNPNEVFYAADRPYGLIEATVQRAGAKPAEKPWMGIAGFC